MVMVQSFFTVRTMRFKKHSETHSALSATRTDPASFR